MTQGALCPLYGDIMTSRKQMELDAFEKSALELAFGKNYESSRNFMWIKKFFPDVLQKRIDSFEQFMEPFMDDDGRIDGTLLKSFANGKFGAFESVIPSRPFYLSDISATLKTIFMGEKV